MNLLRGILSSLLLVLNTVLSCGSLYVMSAIRPFLTPTARRRFSQRMDGLIDFWVGNNRRVFDTLRLTPLKLTWAEPEGHGSDAAAALSPKRWYLVISNHQSWTDIVILQNVLWKRIPPIKFFTKRQLIWVPFLGVAMWLLDFPYVRRMSREQIATNPALAEIDRQATVEACARFRDHPTTVLNFLEGTRFTAEKHAAQTARFKNLLNPKVGGLTYVIDGLSDELHRLLDITIVYQDRIPTFWELMQGKCPEVEVFVQPRTLPAALREAPGPEALREHLGPWIEQIWREKDLRLSQSRLEPAASPSAGGQAG